MNLNYNLAGLGYIGKVHLMAMNNFSLLGLPIESNINRKTLITRSPQERLEVAQSLGFQETSRECIFNNNEAIELLDICSPNINHKELLIKSIENNVNVYCEKPLTMSSEETKEILAKYRGSKSRIQLCYIMRYIPAFAKMRAAIKNNAIGNITSFRIEYYHSSYLNPDKPYAWRLNKEISGGGVLYDLGSHVFDILQFLIEPIEEVMCFADTIIKQRKDNKGNYREVTVDDWALTHVHTKNNIRGTVEVSRIAVGDEGIRVRIYGDKGSLIVNVEDSPIDVIYHNYLGNNIYLDENYYINDSYYRHLCKFYPSTKMSQGFFLDAHTASLASFIYQIESNKDIDNVPSLYECKNIEAILTACQDSIENKSFHKIII